MCFTYVCFPGFTALAVVYICHSRAPLPCNLLMDFWRNGVRTEKTKHYRNVGPKLVERGRVRGGGTGLGRKKREVG